MVEKKYKRGDIREDGKIYWGINHNKSLWLTLEKYDQYRLKKTESTKKLMLSQPEIFNKHKRGYKREDGLIFWAIIRKKEVWLTQEKFELYRRKTQQKNKELFEKNRDKILLNNKKYRLENKEKFNAICKKWHKENKERSKISQRNGIAKYRARKKNSCLNITKNQNKIIKCFYEQAKRLEHRLGIKFHVDHIIPIAKGGLHIPTNLQVLPASINFRKNARDIFIWSNLQLN